MEAPAVSGSQTYSELCLAVKNEERRQSELTKRQQYARTGIQAGGNNSSGTHTRGMPRDQATRTKISRPPMRAPPQRRCFNCGSPDHLANKCNTKKEESQGRQSAARRMVGTSEESSPLESAPTQNGNQNQDPFNFLYSSDSDGDVCTVRVSDTGSKPQCARVMIQGVPVIGIIDTAADITIMGGSLFQKVASVAKLKKKNFKPPDVTPHGYDQRPFKLDGRMELEVEFGDKTMKTVVYIKMDAREQLLLSEGVCRQLGLVMYHPDVQVWRGDKNKEPTDIAVVPLVRAKLVNSVRILPQQCSLVSVELEGNFDAAKQLLLEPEDLGCDLQMEQTLLCPLGNNTGTYQVVIENCTGFTQNLDVGVTLGTATEVEEVMPIPITEQKGKAHINQLVANENIQWRKDKLCTLLDKGESALVLNEREKLKVMLMDYHNVFSLGTNERGETDLIQFEINTGDSSPKKQPTRYIPHAARQEVAHLLKEMQEANVIKPSKSPWARRMEHCDFALITANLMN